MKLQRQHPLTDRKPEEVISIYDGKPVEVRKFIREAQSLASRLPKHRYVFNLSTNRYEYLLGFCASIIVGQCTLMPPNRLDNTIEELTQLYPDSYTLTGYDFHEQFLENKGPANKATNSQSDEVPLIPAEQLCAVAFTSGSTGEPSPNPKYWETLRIGSYGNATLLLKNIDEHLHIVATVPPQHMWGLETSILLPLFANVTISDQTPFYPQDIVDVINSLPAPCALVSSPVHLRALLKSGVSSAGLNYIFSATAPMSIKLAKLLEEQFDARLFEVFGCSETGTLAGRHTAKETIWNLSELFELEVKKTRVLIRAEHLPVEVVIHDIIEQIDQHSFKWLGRPQDMINIAGKRGSFAELNQRLLAISGVTDGVIFDPGDKPGRLAAMVVSPNLKPADIVEELKSVVDSAFLPRPVYMVSSLPRQETGKLASAAISQMYDGILKAVRQSPEA